MDVSIIIPLYKRTEWIGLCIEKLLKQEYKGTYEIILVDDGSPNKIEIENVCETYVRSNDNVIFLSHSHRGPAAARNYGVKCSSGQVLCFLDDDSLPEKNWLKEIIRPFINLKDVALVNGRTLSFYREGLPLQLEREVYPAKSWATCNIAYWRDVFDALGGFDEYFKEPSWEDNDLGLRARWKGYTHYYASGAVVYHPHEKSIEEYTKKCLLNGRGVAAFSRKYFFRKPLWSLAAPVLMSRRLAYGIFPEVWLRRTDSDKYLKFMWSYFSLRGFLGEKSQ